MIWESITLPSRCRATLLRFLPIQPVITFSPLLISLTRADFPTIYTTRFAEVKYTFRKLHAPIHESRMITLILMIFSFHAGKG